MNYTRFVEMIMRVERWKTEVRRPKTGGVSERGGERAKGRSDEAICLIYHKLP